MMKFKTMLLCVAVLALVVSPVLAGTGKPPAKKMDIETFLQMNNYELSYGNSRAFFEGFEGGAIPGSWAASVTNADRTWGVSSETGTPAIEGLFCAFIGYDSTNPQDESISFDYALTAGDDQLSFYMGGSRSHAWAGNVAETITVNGTQVFDFDTATETDYTMERFDIDLSAWDGQTVTISFNYVGFDGDLQVLDAVSIDDGTGWIYVPPPPPNCDDAIAIAPGAFNIDGDTSGGTNDFDPESGGCTGYSATGPDVCYVIGLNNGNSFDVTMTTSGWDDSIYLVTDCGDVVNSCVAGDDSYPDGSTFAFTNTTGAYQEYYLIVDGYGATDSGTYTISGHNGGLVATEEASWGSLKSLYR